MRRRWGRNLGSSIILCGIFLTGNVLSYLQYLAFFASISFLLD